NRLYTYTGSAQSFTVPINCIWLHIVMEGGDSGAADNIPGMPGQHIDKMIRVTPGNTLGIVVGAGGGVGSRWVGSTNKPAYFGKAGGTTSLFRDDGDSLLRALGGPKTPEVEQRGDQYWRGQSGWLLIGFGPSPGTPPPLPEPVAVESPPEPSPPCAAGRRTFHDAAAVATFDMPFGCTVLSIELAGAGGAGGSSADGGIGALVTGTIEADWDAAIWDKACKIDIGAGGSGHDGGQRSVISAGATLIAVAGGGGAGGITQGGNGGQSGGAGGVARSCHIGTDSKGGGYTLGGQEAGGGKASSGGAGASACAAYTGSKGGQQTRTGHGDSGSRFYGAPGSADHPGG